MSKAFTTGDESETPLVVPSRAPLPAGTPNYVTPRGLSLLRDELRRLASERARAEAAGDGPDKPRSLAALAARIFELEDRLSGASLVDPAPQPHHEVRFGATVTVRSDSGQERRFQIVGVDEADAKNQRLAFVSPLARALSGKRVGDVVLFRTPRSEEELEVVSIEYLPA